MCPYQEHTSRDSISRYVEALKVYAAHMSNFVSSDMTRYPSATNSQSPSSSRAPKASSSAFDRNTIESFAQEIASLNSRLSSASVSEEFVENPSEPATVLLHQDESSPVIHPRSFKLPSERTYPYARRASISSESSPRLSSYERRQDSSEDRLFLAMFPYVLNSIVPVVLETYEIFDGIDPTNPEAPMHNTRINYRRKKYRLTTSLINFLKPLDPEAFTCHTTEAIEKSQERRPIYSKPITRKIAWKNLKEASQRAGMPQNVGSHSLQKSFGLNHYEFHKVIALLQEIFGHHGPNVTER
ncbi:hypothetical protein P9112_009975 [Eukaryota sp. TZLM1-RC]